MLTLQYVRISFHQQQDKPILFENYDYAWGKNMAVLYLVGIPLILAPLALPVGLLEMHGNGLLEMHGNYCSSYPSSWPW